MYNMEDRCDVCMGRNKKGLGRKLTRRLDIRISEDDFLRLGAICRADGISKTELIRELIFKKFCEKTEYRRNIDWEERK